MKKLKHRKRERLNERIKTEEDSRIVHFNVHCQYLQVFVSKVAKKGIIFQFRSMEGKRLPGQGKNYNCS